MQDAMELLLRKTSSLTLPVPTGSPVSPIPTVTPNYPISEVVTHSGKTTLWVVFWIMLVSTLAFGVMAMRAPVTKRLFHVLTTFITLFATISYFAMATGDGNSFTKIVIYTTGQEIPQVVMRQIFWARYVDWTLTTPLLLLDLCFLAGVNGADIIVAVVADIVMVLTGLFGAFGHNDTQKWGYYAMGCIAYILLAWILVVGGRRTASAKDSQTARLFAMLGGFTLVLWTLYPVVWGLGDGSRILTVDGEIIAYAILDVLAKPVFGIWLLFTHRTTSIEGFWAHGLATEGSLRLEDEDGA